MGFVFFFILGDFLIMYFFLPFFFIYNLLISFIITDMIFCYQLIFFGSSFCSLLCFYIYRKIFPKKVINLLSFFKFIDSLAIVCLLETEYFILIFVRFLFLPQSIVEAILSYVAKSFWSFLVVTLFYHAFNSLIIIYFGQNLYRFINFKFHDWIFYTKLEKFNFFVLIFVAFFKILIPLAFRGFINNQIKNSKKTIEKIKKKRQFKDDYEEETIILLN